MDTKNIKIHILYVFALLLVLCTMAADSLNVRAAENYTFSAGGDVKVVYCPEEKTIYVNGTENMASFPDDNPPQWKKDEIIQGTERIVIEEGITGIGSNCFQDFYNVSTLILGESVMRIGTNAFRNMSSLTELYLPHSVKEIGTEAFRDCTSLTTIYLSGNWAYGERVFYTDSPVATTINSGNWANYYDWTKDNREPYFVFGEDSAETSDEREFENTEGELNAHVSVVQSGDFKVTIPKHINLNGKKGDTNEAVFQITAEGNLPSDALLLVSAKRNFSLYDTAGVKAPLTGTVTQEKGYFVVSDFQANDYHPEYSLARGIDKAPQIIHGKAMVENLTAGTFTGTIQFSVSVVQRNE